MISCDRKSSSTIGVSRILEFVVASKSKVRALVQNNRAPAIVNTEHTELRRPLRFVAQIGDQIKYLWYDRKSLFVVSLQ
jgi:hypothetical protein